MWPLPANSHPSLSSMCIWTKISAELRQYSKFINSAQCEHSIHTQTTQNLNNSKNLGQRDTPTDHGHVWSICTLNLSHQNREDPCIRTDMWGTDTSDMTVLLIHYHPWTNNIKSPLASPLVTHTRKSRLLEKRDLVSMSGLQFLYSEEDRTHFHSTQHCFFQLGPLIFNMSLQLTQLS